MGLIKAGMGAIGGVLADQWKEYFYCDSMTPDVLMCKGQKRISSQGRSSNTSAEDNIISNGSVIAVNVGQCMMIVEQGKVVDLCAEPGEYTYDKSTEPSVFTGDLKESVIQVFQRMGKRFTFGGDTGKDQRVYYFNTKEEQDYLEKYANKRGFIKTAGSDSIKVDGEMYFIRDGKKYFFVPELGNALGTAYDIGNVKITKQGDKNIIETKNGGSPLVVNKNLFEEIKVDDKKAFEMLKKVKL